MGSSPIGHPIRLKFLENDLRWFVVECPVD
jgi:hypothetical protein